MTNHLRHTWASFCHVRAISRNMVTFGVVRFIHTLHTCTRYFFEKGYLITCIFMTHFLSFFVCPFLSLIHTPINSPLAPVSQYTIHTLYTNNATHVFMYISIHHSLTCLLLPRNIRQSQRHSNVHTSFPYHFIPTSPETTRMPF